MLHELFSDRWDRNGGRWQLGAKQPTLDEAVRKFTKTVRFSREDHTTGLVTVAVEWYSPDLAARWANGLVSMVNERLRTEATRNADHSIEYLNKELAKTNVVEIRQAIYKVIEEQVNNAMLANVQREYAFRVIDPAVPPRAQIQTSASPHGYRRCIHRTACRGTYGTYPLRIPWWGLLSRPRLNLVGNAAMRALGKLWALLTRRQRIEAGILLGLMLIGMTVEILSVGLVLPALALMTRANGGTVISTLGKVLPALGHFTREQLVIDGMLALVGVFSL
jgi:hypothetical protein